MQTRLYNGNQKKCVGVQFLIDVTIGHCIQLTFNECKLDRHLDPAPAVDDHSAILHRQY